MHELSMAQGIINAVLETAENNNATEVTEIYIEVGRLAMLNPEQLRFLLDVLLENTMAENARIDISEIPVTISCPECGYEGIANLDDSDHYAPIIECPNCENMRISILDGRDCVVKNIVVEKPEDE